MNSVELISKAIVESLVPGARMHYRLDQAAGQHDFDLQYLDGLIVPLEVTTSTDEEVERSRAAILNTRKGGPFVPRVHCKHDWDIHPLPEANINTIRATIDRYLAAIEAEGLKQFNAFTDADDSSAVSAIFQDLKIEAGRVFRWKPSGRIGIALPGSGGLVEAEAVVHAVEAEAWKADNRRKLGTAEAPERHLFVYVDPNKYLAWVALRDEAPPTILPRLPAEVTDVWAATYEGTPGCYVVWHARHGNGWMHLGYVNVETGERRTI